MPPRAQKGLPLSILSIKPTTASFCDLEPFPPPPVRQGAAPPSGAPPLHFTIQFESSSSWPDDLEAVSHLKTAFYLRLAAQLEETHPEILCDVWREAVLLQTSGFTFIGEVQHEPTLRLLRAAGRADEASALSRRTTTAASQVALLSGVSRRFPAYAPTVRLAKRWISCQLFSSLISDQLLELLAAAPFLLPGVRPPGGTRRAPTSLRAHAARRAHPPRMKTSLML